MKSLAPLALLLLVAACNDPDAPLKCEAFRDAYCDKQGELCSDMTATMCQGIFDESVDCERAVDVADTYGDCLTAIDGLDGCPEDLPLACAGAILLEPVDDEE
jgi:hypothetical protein